MELRHLEHFVAVAEERNFTRAARRLHLVQSALSVSIRSLERELHGSVGGRAHDAPSATSAVRTSAVRTTGAAVRVLLVPARPGQVLLQVTGCVVEPPQERVILAEALELGRRHLAEQGDRIVPGRFPARRVDRREQVPGLGMPGPAEV